MTRSYCHVLSVTEIIELTKRLDIHCSVSLDEADTGMDCEGSPHDDKHTTTPADIDMLACAQAGNPFPLDSKPLVYQQSDAAGALKSTSTEERTSPQRNVRWRPELASLETTHATEDEEKDGDGLTTEELRDFQSEREAQMRQKTERFLHMVSQYSWRPRVVEDLGEIFEIED
ncbi:hypothetical protein NEUTE2DRAFT_122959 [Neurospora tetrasperma FGSC 2509]|nr:hypothetical protein NEUTE2DRAFT_122959 [Neurospora tetrasperma FGSC 2509]